MLPKRRKPPRSGIRDEDGPIRCPGHLKWIRGHMCAVSDFECEGRIEAAHVRGSQEGGMGMKPGDNWTIPLCSAHHRDQHQIGEPAFEREYRIDMRAIATAMWLRSPQGQKYRRGHDKL